MPHVPSCRELEDLRVRGRGSRSTAAGSPRRPSTSLGTSEEAVSVLGRHAGREAGREPRRDEPHARTRPRSSSASVSWRLPRDCRREPTPLDEVRSAPRRDREPRRRSSSSSELYVVREASQRISRPRPRSPRASTVAARRDDDVLDDREPEARAARGAGLVGAVEALEQAGRGRLAETPTPSSAPVRTTRSPSRSTRNAKVGAVAGVADRVLRQVLGDDRAACAGGAAARRPRAPSTASSTPARAAASSSSATTSREHRQRRRAAERDDARGRSRARCRKRISSISSPAFSTSSRACSISASDVGARQRGAVEQRQDPRERRPQLVRDGGGEAGAQLARTTAVVAAYDRRPRRHRDRPIIAAPGSIVGAWPRS